MSSLWMDPCFHSISLSQSRKPEPISRDVQQTPPWTIFYNIFIPTNDTTGAAQIRAQHIFREQISFVGQSYASNYTSRVSQNATQSDESDDWRGQQETKYRVTVYFNTIGDGEALNTSFIHNVCVEYNVKCQHMGHFNVGYEDVTLQRLYDFCQDAPSPTHRVVYIHNKGSFHKARYQNDNRRILTKAVLSQACLGPRDNDENDPTLCNLCGHGFTPVWGLYMAGNFFTAHCFYIRKLFPLRLTNETMEQLHRDYLTLKKEKTLVANILPVLGPYAWGTGRYSHEHWVASHPSVQPCDVHADNEQEKELMSRSPLTRARMAPRAPLVWSQTTEFSARSICECANSFSCLAICFEHTLCMVRFLPIKWIQTSLKL